MADILASLAVAIGAETSGLQKGIAIAKKELRGLVNFGASLQDLGKNLTVGLTAPLVAASIGAVKLAADMETAAVSFEVMLGSAAEAKKLLGGLQQFAASTPFEFPEIQDAGKKLLAFGIGSQDIVGSLTKLGDVAAGVGVPLGDIAEIYGKARVQGRLFAEDINQLTGRGIPIIGELAKQFGVAEKDVRKLVESGQVGFPQLERAFTDLTAQGGKFGGLMARQSETVNGLFSTATDGLRGLGVQLGEEITKVFDVAGLLKGTVAGLDGLGKSFAALDPVTKQTALGVGAVAAAVGPLSFGLGALLKALPLITNGFGLLVSPVGLVVAGLTAAGVAAAYFAAASKTSAEQLDEQRAGVAGLESKLNPLLARYEDLKAKTSLNAAEQEELRKVIYDVGQQVPDAITAFDGYGRALDINAEAVARFMETQRAALRAQNRAVIEETKALYDKLYKERNELEARLFKGTATRTIDQGPMLPALTFEGALSAEEQQRLQTDLEALNNRVFETGAYLDKLNGILPETAADMEGVGAGAGKAAGALTDTGKALESLNLRLLENQRLLTAFGREQELVEARAKLLEDGVVSLVENGYKLASPAVLKFTEELRKLNEELRSNVKLSAVPVQTVTPTLDTDPQKTKGEKSIFDAPPLNLAPIKEGRGLLKEQQDQVLIDLDNFNAAATAAINAGMAGVAAGLGEGIGNILSGASGLDALPALLLTPLADMAIQLGKIAIGTGIALLGIKVALETLGGVGAIAAGIALVAVGTAAKGAIGRLAGGGGGGAGSYSPPSVRSYTAPSAANRAPTTLEGTTREVVFRLVGRDLIGAYDRNTDGRLRVTGR